MLDAPYLDSQSFNWILDQLQTSPLISNLIPGKEERFVFEGQIEVQGQHVTVQVVLDKNFPLQPPSIFLVPWDALGFIPHVIEPYGFICYLQQEGLLLDRRNPVGIIEEALDRAILTLTRGIRGDNQIDFVDEFESYWSRLNGVKLVLSFIEPTQSVRKVIAVKSSKGADQDYILFSDSIATINTYFGNFRPCTLRNALYVPLEVGTFILPPQSGSFWSIEEIRELVYSNISRDNTRTLQKLTKKGKQEEVVILRLPRPSGGAALFAIFYTGVKNGHPLRQGGKAKHIAPLMLQRHDKEYLMPRGGANLSELQEKRIALIGCGSVGGFIALELSRVGILKQMLIDHENLAPENTFRHVLGKDAWGTPKVQALKMEIERKIPYAQIETVAKRVEDALQTDVFRPDNYDLIIVALGDDTISLHLNEVFHTNGKTPPVVFTWLEPYGIGGHALLTGNSDQKGCLECLFTPVLGDDDNWLYNRASFAANGQSFGKDISGCGNLFTPYGSTDALQTAILACRLATDALLGEITGNPLLSWKGNDREFLRAGFKLSSRFRLTREELSKQCYDYYNPQCLVCGPAM